MDIKTSYSVKIKDYNHIFENTAFLYRNAVTFYIHVILCEWDRTFSGIGTNTAAVNAAEKLSIVTKRRPSVKYDFGKEMYKFPCYLRRAAIAEAFGKVSSYKSSLKNWKNSDPRTRGKEPSTPKAGRIYPALYHDGCYVRIDDYTAKIKVFTRNTWDWLTIRLRKTDVNYILHHCRNRKGKCPTLRKRGKNWYLDFPFMENVKLNETDVSAQTIVAVDLGVNSACVCSIMHSDGTVAGRHFLRLSAENDSLKRRIDRIKYAQRHGSRKTSGLWRLANGVNNDIAVKTAAFITDVAVYYNADAIVFEHLELSGRKKGSRKQRLHLWKARTVQRIVADKAHRLGIRISHINAWGTSRLAFDGSGRVLRGDESKRTNGNYSICEFQSGKLYNCDLNASYNIGARYFVREIIKTLPATEGQRIAAKVPECVKRSTCTLSTLIKLNAELCAAA